MHFVNWILLLLFVVACGRFGQKESERINDIQPIPSSYLNMKVKLPVSELETGLNKVVNLELADQGIELNGKKDSLFIKINRRRDFDLAYKKDRLYVAVPVRVTAAIKKRVLGITIDNRSNPIKFEAIVNTSARFFLNDEWDLDIECKWEGIDLEKEPDIEILGMKVNLSKMVLRALDESREQIEETMCGTIQEKLRLRTIIENVYHDLQNPIRIAKQPIPLFLQTTPLGLKGSLVRGTQDTVMLHLEYQSQLLIGPNQEINPNPQNLESRAKPMSKETAFTVFPSIEVPFSALERLLNEALADTPFEYEGYVAELSDVQLGADNGLVTLTATSSGDINGRFKLQGIPELKDDMILGFKSLEYSLEEADSWLQMTDMAAHSSIVEFIKSKAKMDVSEFFDDLDNRAADGINLSNLGNKVQVDLNFSKVKLYNQGLSKDRIQFVLQADGEASVVLKSNIFK
ncbi:MAG: DUF4403 family protein [Cyclobacteriaceae bacterium]